MAQPSAQTKRKACQIAWCFAFRPSLDTPSLLWISAVCLSGRWLLGLFEVMPGQGYKDNRVFF